MAMDRTKPPPGWEHYPTCWDGGPSDEYVYAWATEAAHYAEGFDTITLAESWRIYDAETLPARVALMRELAAEMSAESKRDDLRDAPPDAMLALWSRTLNKRAAAMEKP